MLKEGMKNYMNSMARVYFYKFIARYVRKVHPDSIIMRDLSENVGVSFIDMITPSNIAYVICLVKNGKDMWDHKNRLMESGDDAEKKLRPLYTEGQGKRKELGKNLFINKGVKFFKQAEKKWKETYKNENMMRILYPWFEDWLNDVRKQIKVGDNSSRTYHLVMVMWRAEETEDNKTKKGGKAAPSNNSDESTNESDVNDNNEGYMSDSGLRLLSKKWLKEEMEQKKRSKENDRDARARSPTGGARSHLKRRWQVLLPRQRQVVQRVGREAQL